MNKLLNLPLLPSLTKIIFFLFLAQEAQRRDLAMLAKRTTLRDYGQDSLGPRLPLLASVCLWRRGRLGLACTTAAHPLLPRLALLTHVTPPSSEYMA